jgi:hypothetical protein
MACHQHTQQGHQNLLRDFNNNVVMVLQPHNSKLTIELLQVLQQCSYGPTTTQQQAHKELLQDLQTFSQQIN